MIPHLKSDMVKHADIEYYSIHFILYIIFVQL